MKAAVINLPIVIVLIIASGFSSDASQASKNERIEVSFNRKMQFNDLVKIKLDLAESGITIEYRLLEFDPQGGLKSLEFRVDCNDGFSGSGENNEIYNQTRWGFYRDYRENVTSPFGVGSLD